MQVKYRVTLEYNPLHQNVANKDLQNISKSYKKER